MTHAFRIGRCVVLPRTRQVLRDGRDVRVGGRAFDLLVALIDTRERVASAEELIDRIWPHVAVEPNNLYVQVWALRRALGPGALATVARRGYRLAVPVEPFDPARHPIATATPPGPVPARSRPGSARAGAASCDATRQAGGGASPRDRLIDTLADDLTRAVWTHRRITLVGADEALRARVWQAASERLRQTSGSPVWRLAPTVLADGSGPAPATRRILERLRRDGAVVVVEDADRRARAAMADLASDPDAAGGLFVLATAARARALPGERLFRLPTGVRTPAAERAPAAAPLRWRTRSVPQRPVPEPAAR